jgi:hypothetical protein
MEIEYATLNNGIDFIIRICDCAIINKNFEVKAGATFEIK